MKFNASIETLLSESEDKLKEIHATLNSNLADIEKQLSKNINQLILILLVYLVISQSAVESIEFGLLKTKNLDIALKIFPLIIGYKLYSACGLQTYRQLLTRVNDEIVKKLYPKLEESQLDYLLKPQHTIGTEEVFEYRNPGDNARVSEILRLIILALQLILLPLSTLVYSVYTNFKKFGAQDWLVWFVFAFVILFVIQSTLVFMGHSKEGLT